MSTEDGERIDVPSMHDVPALITKYVNQLLNGCGNEHCDESLCYTGQLNTQKLPVRKPTARTARTIAITICSGSKPERHLCRFYNPVQVTPEAEAVQTGKGYDYSSLAQLLSEKLTTGPSDVPAYPLALELRTLHGQLDSLEKSAYPSNLAQEVPSNTHLADALIPYLDWLTRKLPLRRLAVWEMLDRDIISRGRAYPQKLENRPNDDQYNTWLTILDVLDNEMYLRLLRRVVKVVASRMALQRLISAGKSDLSKQRNTIQGHLASKWCRNGRMAAFALVVWLKKLFAKQWKSDAIVVEDSIEHAILELFHRLGFHGDICEMLCLPVIRSRLGELELAKSLLSVESGVRLLKYPALFEEAQLFVLFRAASHLRMREAHSASLKAEGLRQKQHTSLGLKLDSISTQARHSEEHYLLLNVSRTDILKDTFDQLWRRRKTELRLPLRVRLGHTDDLEVGHDLGGVQIEFFNVACREIMSQHAQMFDTDTTTGISYFRPGSLQPLHMFELFGMIVALAMYNGVTLPIRLPPFFYWLMAARGDWSSFHIPIDWICDVWPATGHSLKAILDQDIEGLEFAFPLEANGLRLSAVYPPRGSACHEMKVISATPIRHHQETGPGSSTVTRNIVDITDIQNAWPGWTLVRSEVDPGEVTPENKAEYVDCYIKWLTFVSVSPQLHGFVKGFRATGLVPPSALELFNFIGLKTLVEGTDVLDIDELRSVTGYDGYEKTSKYIQNFWRIVTGWSQEKQKLLLKFVTAAERIPITGASSMVFVIKRANVDNIEDLPRSSTCFGTLLLPRYASSEILAQKLDLALKYGTEGFGTG